jgi:hypothetical protein
MSLCAILDTAVATYLTSECLEEVHARMTRDLAYESALLVEVHSLEVRVIACKDLAGLWDNPDLEWALIEDSSSARVAIDIPRSYHLQ